MTTNLHGAIATTTKNDNEVCVLVEYPRTKDALTVTFSPVDEDGYRDASLECFDGFQIVSPSVDLERFAAHLFLIATDERNDYGTESITDLWID